LHDQSEGDNQCRALRRAEEVQPHRGGNNAESKAGEAGDEGRGESRTDKQYQIGDIETAHGIPHRSRRSATAAVIGQRLAKSG
jgi:hypothetical protein